jgi:hypothetical protein
MRLRRVRAPLHLDSHIKLRSAEHIKGETMRRNENRPKKLTLRLSRDRLASVSGGEPGGSGKDSCYASRQHKSWAGANSCKAGECDSHGVVQSYQYDWNKNNPNTQGCPAPQNPSGGYLSCPCGSKVCNK